ncbi:MAG TPA: T9SS type A sorting domain-containing protein [Ignavibacteriaceae bacterium]
MYRSIYILLLIFAANPIYSQISRENGYNLSIPANISSNTSFDLSLIVSNPYEDADKLVLYINMPSRLNIKNLELRTFSGVTVISCRQTNLDAMQGNVYRADIDLNKNKIASDSYFQLLFTLKNDNGTAADINLSGIYKAGGKTVGFLKAPTNFEDNDSLRFSSLHLKFYKPQRFAGNSIRLISGSELNIALIDQQVKNLLTEFWIEIGNKQTDFLKVINQKSGSGLINLSTNQFQMLTIQSQNQADQGVINPCFLSRGSWYHFSILTSFDQNNISIYCGSSLIGIFSMPANLKPDDLSWEFGCDSQNKEFQLDVLRFVNFNDEIGISFSNQNYLNYAGENSKVIYQFNFDKEDELYFARDILNVTFGQVEFLKSDAPVFARAPELNINMIGNIYELTWSGGDYKEARSYSVEKSVNNSDFQQLSSIDADNSDEQEYSFMDARDAGADIVYYRIKQVNIDGSVVYSSQVKIGQGKEEPFIVEQNYPNPFNPRTSIIVDLREDSDVEITVYNLEGKEVAKLYKGYLTSGTHKFSFDASQLSSGIYLYKVSTPTYSNTKKMILTK